jgi:hypothetical protein
VEVVYVHDLLTTWHSWLLTVVPRLLHQPSHRWYRSLDSFLLLPHTEKSDASGHNTEGENFADGPHRHCSRHGLHYRIHHGNAVRRPNQAMELQHSNRSSRRLHPPHHYLRHVGVLPRRTSRRCTPPDPRPQRLGLLLLRTILRGLVLHRHILPSHLLPEHRQRQSHPIWRPKLTFDHRRHDCSHPLRCHCLQNRHRNTDHDSRRNARNNRCWPSIYPQYRDRDGQMDRVSDPRWFRMGSLVPGSHYAWTGDRGPD